jgi:hemerythrin superfamily protein
MAGGTSALDLIAQDHRSVEELFQRYETSQDPEERTQIVHKVIHDLAVHGEVEELLFYPRVRKAVPEGDRLVEEALHEHLEMKQTLNELDSMTADDVGFDDRMRQLMNEVRHHVAEEENEIFPTVRLAVSQEDLAALGQRLERAKSFVPTRPHPRAPTSPAGKAVAAPGAALIDRIRDAIRKAAD